MKKIPFLLFATIFIFLSSANAKIEVVLGEVPLSENENVLPIPPSSLNNSTEVILSRKQYVVSYNRKTRLPNWTSWKVDVGDIGHIGRTNVFTPDRLLENYLADKSEHVIQPTDYYGSCYDRGHQVPSADRNDTIENNQATFIMSNMIPQTAYLNRVIWEHLESYTRDLVVNQGKKVFVVAGPIYDENFGMIGPENNIPVPSKNFKIIYILEAGQSSNDINVSTPTIAVIMPNILRSGKKPIEDQQELCSSSTHPFASSTPAIKDDWKKYQTTVSEIEKESGFKITKF
jgi:DNA/RNA endonuclease G (NUC1)